MAERGGTLVVLGENRVHEWLPGLEWEPRPTNFWWWRTGEDPGIRVRAPHHSIWRFLTAREVTWHYHGLLHVTAGVTPLAVLEEESREAGVLLYEDRTTTAGRIVVTTLDPIYHHGSNFMPAASGFLRGLLRWLEGAQSRSVKLR